MILYHENVKLLIFIKNINSLVQVHKESKDVFHTYWMVSILTRTAEEREELRNHLADKLIETRPVFTCPHDANVLGKISKAPMAEDLGWRGINLPSFPSLSNEQVIYICESINEFYSDK